MGRTLQQCRRTCCRVLRLCESMRSSPACLRPDRSHSSFPCSPAREPTLPVCVQVCASAFSPFLLALGSILFVADLFHPVDGLAVELFYNGDVCHRRG